MLTQLTAPRLPLRRLRPARFTPFLGPAGFDAGFDRWFGSVGPFANSAGFAPAIDVENLEHEIRLRAELPGLDDADFEVLVEQNVLTIKGEKRSEQSSDEGALHRVERSSGSFERRFDLGWDVDADTVKASYVNGVLTVSVPKPVEEKETVRSIPVTAASD
jgi:HSP20 family protein